MTAASVTRTHIVVASCGASMPEPLQMAETMAVFPPSITSRAAIFGRVSVVMMASAARSGWSPELLHQRRQRGHDLHGRQPLRR